MEAIHAGLANKDILLRYIRANNTAQVLAKYAYVRVKRIQVGSADAGDHFVAKLKGFTADNRSVLVVVGANTLTIPLDRVSNQRVTEAEAREYLEASAMEVGTTAPSSATVPISTTPASTGQQPVRGVLGYRPPTHASTSDPRGEERLRELEGKLQELEATHTKLKGEYEKQTQQMKELHRLFTNVTMEKQTLQLRLDQAKQREVDQEQAVLTLVAQHTQHIKELEDKHAQAMRRQEEAIRRQLRAHPIQETAPNTSSNDLKRAREDDSTTPGDRAATSLHGTMQSDLVALLRSAQGRILQLTIQLTRAKEHSISRN